MFYLVSYLKTLWHGKSVGLFYAVITLAILIFSGNLFVFKQKYIDQNTNPYFNALFNSKSKPNELVEKLESIPGVEAVILSENLHKNNDVSGLLKKTSANYAKSLLNSKYVNLKVELSPHLELSSQSLIKEYLQKMLSGKKVTMTRVITKQVASRTNDPIKYLLVNYGHFMVLGFLFCVWVFATWSISQKLQNRSYLINMFQRRKYVTFKVFTSGQVLWLCASLILSLYLGGNTLFLFAAFFLLTITGLSLLSIRKNEFIKA